MRYAFPATLVCVCAMLAMHYTLLARNLERAAVQANEPSELLYAACAAGERDADDLAVPPQAMASLAHDDE